MRPRLVLAFSALFFASPLAAATPSVSEAPDPVQRAISEVLRQEGFGESTAAALAARIIERLSAGAVNAGPRLAEREPGAPTEWKDALPGENVVEEIAAVPAAISHGVEKSYPENVANFVIEETEEATRLVILKHLKTIEESGHMSEAIITDAYWFDVFNREGYGDVYEASRPLLKKALRAGLRPYKEGKGLDARTFAQLAARALQPPTEMAANTDLLQR